MALVVRTRSDPLDLAHAVRERRPPRASAQMAYHVCEVMHGMLASPALGQFVDISSSCVAPELLPENFPNGKG